MENTGNGWGEYKRLVLKQLEDLTSEVKEVNGKLDELKTDVVVLKVKAWMFGVLGGTIVTIIAQLMIKYLPK